jgi:PST family polysaccharide transporter
MTINYWARQADDLLIGKFMGPAHLGIYGRAYATMMLPVREISSVLGRVLFPALSRMGNDKPRVREMYLECLGLIAFLSFPIMALLAATADSLIITLYGQQWERVATVLRIFCAVGAFQSLGTTVGYIYQSQGRTDWMLRWGLVASTLMIASFVVGIYIGSIEAVALCYAIVTVGILSYPQFAVPGRLIGMTVFDVVRAVWQVAVCALIAALVVWLLGHYALRGQSPALTLAAQFPLGVLLYLALVRLLAPVHMTRVRELLFARQKSGGTA